MGKQKPLIPNPNRISKIEQDFIHPSNSEANEGHELVIKEQYKGRMISMSDSFYSKLNNYLRKNPTEGNRSGFVVRVVAEYIEKKSHNI